ncbi:MAG: 4a-hydroxytetrahydrobiopterin dehydratase [Fimbriimonadaceae bacterium]
MARLSYEKLTAGEIAEELDSTDEWSVVDGALTKEFKFERYKDGLVFGMAVGFAADELNHHPDLIIGYGVVRVSLVTHDAGGGLTGYDFEFARRVDRLGT